MTASRVVRQYSPVTNETTWHIEKRFWFFFWDRVSIYYYAESHCMDAYRNVFLRNGGKFESEVVCENHQA